MLMCGKCECFAMQMFVSCVHHVAVPNAAFVKFVNADRGCKRQPYDGGIL